jgi:serine protease Do
MRKTTLIALTSFLAGLTIAAFIFVYIPRSDEGKILQAQNPSEELSSNLYAADTTSPQRIRTDVEFTGVADKVSPAVVYIEAEKVERVRIRNFFDSPFDFWDRFFDAPRDRQDREQEQRSMASGTGFFISPDGYLVTNNHVVEKAVEVTVTTLSERQYKAEVIGTDPETDTALLKVDADNLPYAEFGSSESLQVGEWVLAIGNPLGLNHTVTAGIVSAKGRLIPNLNLTYQDFIQTDAAINMGNSGGPLLNTQGEVIGINTIIFAPSGGNIGIGFAISSDLAKKVIPQLRENGKVIRGYLGIGAYSVTEDVLEVLQVEEKTGAWIAKVDAGSPADKAGLQDYDVIVAVDGQPIEDSNDLTFKIAEIKPGTRTDLTVMRDGKEKTVSVKIGEKDEDDVEEPETKPGKGIGITVQELTPRLARRYGYEIQEGVVIVEIESYSQAARAGLKVGDVIVEADRQETVSVKDLEKILDKKKAGDSVLLRIYRRGSADTFMATIRIPE